jgi:hypothetical protein
MVSVQKFHPIPRLSIIVPVGRDLAAFERTLISVLENQPTGCEILVAHDGKYTDPFQLCDEVRFVIAESSRLVDLVAVGTEGAQGRFVHVLADGVEATAGWIEEALEKFEHSDAGSVAPVIRHTATQRIQAAGWCDGGDRLCKTAHQGRDQIETDSPQIVGAYLQASFWRREVLRSLTGAFTGHQSIEAAYAYEHLIRAAGWRCILATECNLLNNSSRLPWDSTSLGRGKRLRAIHNHFCRHRVLSRSFSAASSALLANALRPKYLVEALGQAVAPLAAGQMAQQLHLDVVTPCGDHEVVVSTPRQSSYAA